MPLKTLAALAIAILASLSLVADPARAQTLRYDADEGETHTYVRTQQDHVTQTVNGAEQKAEVKSYWRFGARIEDGEDGGRTVEVVHDSLSIEAVPQVASDFTGLYGKPVRIVMDERGSVTEVVLPDSVPEAAGRLDLAATYRGFYPVLPVEPVEQGRTWSDTMNVNTTQSGLDMTIQRVNHYTAAGSAEYAGQSALKIDYTTEVSIEGSGTQQGADISLSGQGTGTGSFYFRPDPGLYLGGTERSEVKMDAFVVAGTQNLLIPIVQLREETIELVD
jgi:hypothetical protein